MNHFQRWSRRKRGVIGDDEIDDATASAGREEASDAPSAEPVAAPEAPATDPEAELPDPDSLPAGSDITAFMAPGVSAGLRRRALKRLFAADHYGIRDGLDDYDQDFRRTLTPLASQAAERLRRWLDEPVGGRDDAAAGEPREVAGDATPSAGDEPRDDGDGENVAASQTETLPASAGDAPLDQGALAQTGKPIKTR
ncbi:DUF3306 domain-containing protein [Halomonas stenophila]|uniref:DUF3306 domain-containing protein n=1 Tax=Halomonas stenophila TaxID=795312 RepID=A0A7W5ER26_9GAMM|nr:DUF3306 domain-containing protein [Halomonas stenophila]MBB3229878.1 hypothetical protein [Halomonas stenophila]